MEALIAVSPEEERNQTKRRRETRRRHKTRSPKVFHPTPAHLEGPVFRLHPQQISSIKETKHLFPIN
jgi:hypothetical protein